MSELGLWIWSGEKARVSTRDCALSHHLCLSAKLGASRELRYFSVGSSSLDVVTFS